MKRLKEMMKSALILLWSHRAMYAALALAYGAGCAGMIEKETVSQICVGVYASMWAQRH